MTTYPFEINQDGTATCWNCSGEAIGCVTCGGNGYIEAAEVARIEALAVEAVERQPVTVLADSGPFSLDLADQEEPF